MQTGCGMALSGSLRCCQRVLSWVPVVIIVLVVLWLYYAYVCELCLGEQRMSIGMLSPGTDNNVYWRNSVVTLMEEKFLLPYTEKERYDNEERSEIQRQFLAEFAKKLPIYTQTANGG
ncbi:palmitoyltransferase ZDHHC15-like [Pyxicephalus adspersus]|uniref:palmitoyltransferase ZDHHC15-like n=1 Tax=Pyxicephalus adspersus TaxID=30357 RepID=UPI003B59CA75